MTTGRPSASDSPPSPGLTHGTLPPLLLLGLLWGATTTIARQLGLRGVPALGYAPWITLGAGVVVSGSFYPLWSAPGLEAGLVLLHLLGAALAFVLYFVLLRLSGPVYFSQVAYLVTLWGVGLGMVLLGERHSPWVWLSLVLIFAGLALVNRRDRPASA